MQIASERMCYNLLYDYTTSRYPDKHNKPTTKTKTMIVIQELKKQESANINDDFRILKALKSGKYKMSIQGSTGHYCSPRVTLPIEDYDSMELALFNKNGWFHITRSSVLRAFPRYNELLERADGINSPAPVFGYVSVDLINDLYVYLNGA